MKKVKSLSLRQNFAWAFTGNVVHVGCRWAMLVLLAKFSEAAVVGTFALALAIATPITLFSGLQLQSVFITDVRREYSFQEYVHFRMMAIIFSIICITGIGISLENSYNSAYVIPIVGMSQGILSIREIYLAAMQKKERMDMVSHSNMLLGILSLSFFGLMLWLSGSLVLAVTAILGVRIALFLFFDVARVKRFDEYMAHKSDDTDSGSVRRMAYLLWISLPLGASVAVISLNSSVPRYFLERFYNKEILGYFAAMASLLAAGQMVIAALGQSAAPRLATYYVYNRKAFSILTAKLAAVGVFLGVCALCVTYFWGRSILTLLFKPEYAEHHGELNLIMIAGAIIYCYSFIGYSITAARYFKSITFLSIGTLTATLVSAWSLIPPYGIKGAAWGMIITSLTGCIMSIIIVIFAVSNKKQIDGDSEAGSAVEVEGSNQRF